MIGYSLIAAALVAALVLGLVWLVFGAWAAFALLALLVAVLLWLFARSWRPIPPYDG